MIRQIKNRIRETRAFTLAETLVAIIIMLLVTAIVAAGIPAAARAYENVFIASNAEVLLSTTMSALRNELSTAKDIDLSDKIGSTETYNTISYYNQAFGSISRISNQGSTDAEKPGNLMYQRYAKPEWLGSSDTFEATGSTTDFISPEASGKNLYVTYTSISGPDEDGIITVNGLRVLKKGTGSEESRATPAQRDHFYIRVVTD